MKNPADKVEQWDINKLVPYARNARTHTDEQVAQIAASIKEWGFTTAVLVDEDGGIIAGHGRTLAAQRLKMTTVPVMVAAGWSDAKKRAYVIADNKLALNAGWDNELLALEFAELKDLDFDLDLTGFTADEISALMPVDVTDGLVDEDQIPEVPEVSITVQGDVWVLGKHRLMCGDSTSIDAVDKLMNGKKADMVFTDPPYGMFLNTDYSQIKGSTKSIGFKGNKTGNKYDKIIGDNEDFTPELITTIFDYFGYAKEIFVFGADYFIDLLPNYGKDGALLIWNKRSSDEQQKGIGNTFEIFFSKVKHKKYVFNFEWFGFLSKDAPQEARNRVHPSMKPIGLIEKIWLWYKIDNKFNLVVDLYGGAGATLIACEKTNKSCYMMELDPKYCDVIIKRWQEFTGKIAVHADTNIPFAEVTHGNEKENN